MGKDTKGTRDAGSAATGAFLLLGAYTLLVQVQVLREGFTLFSGNELSVSLQLGLWLVFTAAGGIVGTFVPGRAAPLLLALLPVSGLWAPFAVRMIPLMLPVAVGGEIPFTHAVFSLAVSLLPFNVTAGAVFPTACRFFAHDNEGQAIGLFYRLEAVGAAACGAVFTFMVAGNVRGLNATVWAAAAAAAASSLLLWKRSRTVRVAGTMLTAACICLALLKPGGLVDNLWWGKRHPGSVLLKTMETRYQRIDVGMLNGQHTMYLNGSPAFTFEDLDESMSGYRSADFLLSFHDNPKRVLVVGGGEPGLVSRALEYPIAELVYVTLDPAIPRIVREFCAGEKFRWADDRLTVISGDGRYYLRTSDERFDIIILDLPPPTTAAGNRFFTVEAFKAARLHLKRGGLLIFQMPSSAHYLAGDTALLLGSVYRALRQSFGQAEIIAGDTMIFVAGLSDALPPLELLAERFAQKNVPVRLASGRNIRDADLKQKVFSALYSDRFNRFRTEQQFKELDETSVSANSDLRPVAYYLNMRRWVRELGLGAGPLQAACGAAEGAFAFTEQHWKSLTLVAVVLGCIPLLLGIAAPGARRTLRRSSLAFAILCSGFAGMLGEIVIVFIYQSTFGQVYSVMGLLFALYMVGLAAGSTVTAGRSASPAGRARMLILTRALMILTCLAALKLVTIESQTAMGAALFMYAFAIGMEYPVAAEIYRTDEAGKRAAGLLHGMDSIGAAIATLLGGTLLLPIAGAFYMLPAILLLHFLVIVALGSQLFNRLKLGNKSLNSD